MREWTERHIRELIKKTYREIRDDGKYKKKDIAKLKGSFMKILGRGAYVKHLPTWGIGYLIGDLKFVSLPHVKFSGGATASDYFYYGTEPILAFSLTSVSDYSHSRVEGKPDFIFMNGLTKVKGGFGFYVPETLPGPLRDLATALASLFGDGDNGVYSIDTQVPLSTLYAYNFRGESKTVEVHPAGPYSLTSVNIRDTKYSGYTGTEVYGLYMSDVLEDRSFGTDLIFTTAEMSSEVARQIHQEVFDNTTDTRTYSIKEINLFKLLYGNGFEKGYVNENEKGEN